MVVATTASLDTRPRHRPEPDLAVVPGRPRDYSAHPNSAALVVEVSDSLLSFDMNQKRLLYARAGIRDYWVVDVNSRRLLVYRNPQAGDYGTPRQLGESDTVSPLAAPTANVLVADLFA